MNKNKKQNKKMAQQVSFNINLKVNGQDSVREVSVNMEELRHAIDEVKTGAEKATSSFIRFNPCGHH